MQRVDKNSIHSQHVYVINWGIECANIRNLQANIPQAVYIILLSRVYLTFNPFKPEFTIVIFIHYKPRIAVAILDL